MKPPKFAYHAPRSLAEALQVLAEAADDAVLLAGGQSLIPLLNLRLASPRDVVDLGRVPGLDDIRLVNGHAEVGALVTHHRMEVDPLIGHSVPLAQRAAGYVGFRAIRNRGTVGGSVAHADPAAEWPLALLTLDGEVALASARGTRTVRADDFFRSTYTTARRSDEAVTSVRFSTRFERNWGFWEFQRRTGDFATVAVAVACDIEDGEVVEARVGIAGAADKPLRCTQAEQALSAGSRTAVREAATAASDAVQPPDDIHGSSSFRKRLVFAATQRAAAEALGHIDWAHSSA